jgi:NhaP-type Na+/H+ or K+/H+ antiporter
MQEDVLVQLAAIVVLGIGAQWVAWRLNLPAILLLLIAGLAAGPGAEWLGFGRLVDPNALLGDTLPPVISLSVAVILFEGGLSLRLADLRTSGGVIRNLVSVGAGVTWLVGSLAARFLVGVPWPLAILLGAILVVTGPTVIGPLLRHVRPSGGVGPILMWEGIVIDPIGAVLAVLVFEVISSADTPGAGLTVLVTGGLMTLVIGLVIGLVGALAMIWMLGRYWVPDYLHNPVALMLVVATFTLSDLLREESGLLTVTVMGLVLANQRSVSIRHIAEFKESLTVLLVSVLFVVLAARLSPEQIAAAGPGSVLFTLALIVVARPVAVLASTIGSGLGWPERLFLMSMAPRGIVAAAVASVFALRLRREGIAGAELLVPAAFTAIIGTVIVYGLASGPVARRLGLTGGRLGYLIAGANPIGLAIARALRDETIPVMLVDTRTDRLHSADHEGIPTLNASILSPFVRERIDSGRIGRLLAVTPNEEVNSLAALHFTSLFGRESVFQLTPEPHGAARSPSNHDADPEPDVATSLSAQIDAADAHEAGRAVALELHGRVLFGPGMTYKYLDAMLYNGATIQRLPLEDGDDPAEAFRQQFGPEAVPLLIAKEGGDVVPVTAAPLPDARTPRAVIGLSPAPRHRDA